VSITDQPISVCGEAKAMLELGIQTYWTILAVDNLRESDLGGDFIESQHKRVLKNLSYG